MGEIEFELRGIHDGKKVVFLCGYAKVGGAVVKVYEGIDDLENKLRAVLGAMHLAKAAGFADFDIPNVESWKDDRISARMMVNVFESISPEEKFEVKTAAARFIDAIPDEHSESYDCLLQEEQRTDQTFSQVDSSRTACQVSEWRKRFGRDHEA